MRFVIIEPTLNDWEATAVDAGAEPPRITINVSITAVRFVADDITGEHIAGSRDVEHRLQLVWTLALFQTAPDPWRLLASTNPAVEVPGLPYELPDPAGEQTLSAQTVVLRAAKLREKIDSAPRVQALSAPAKEIMPAEHSGADTIVGRARSMARKLSASTRRRGRT